MVHDTGDTTLSATGGDRRGEPPGAQPYLFLVLQGHRPLAPPARFTLHDLDEIVIGRGRERRITVSVDAGVRRALVQLDDPWLSSRHARVRRILGRYLLEDLESKNGSFVGGTPQKRAEMDDGDVLELGHCLFLFREGLPRASDPAPIFEPDPAAGPASWTLSPSWGETLARAIRVARSDIPVILHGETGTGKEVLARALHASSGRRGDLVAVNCGALPRDLVEAELFGHRKGAFSGATEDRLGLLRCADGGTLLLDEIGDMPLAAQTALLRALQEGEVRPVGGTRPVAVDLRVIAATHRDLDEHVRAGQFRADLHARLAGHQIELPALRDRKEDLGVFVSALLGGNGAQAGPGGVTFTAAAARALLAHDWPGNVRELQKCLVTARVLAAGAEIDVTHLPPAVRRATEAAAARRAGERAKRERLIALLREHGGNLSAVARQMGKARVQIQRWVKRYGLDPEQFRR